jgi:hypothetical protein
MRRRKRRTLIDRYIVRFPHRKDTDAWRQKVRLVVILRVSGQEGLMACLAVGFARAMAVTCARRRRSQRAAREAKRTRGRDAFPSPQGGNANVASLSGPIGN